MVQQIFVYIDEEFPINRIQPKFLSLLMTGIFPRGMTELVCIKRSLTRGDVTVI